MSSYVPNTFEDRAAMLEKIGVKSIADLFDVPKGCEVDLNLPAGKSPLEVERIINALGAKNKVFRTMFLGAGAYNHYISPVVSELAAREEFVTAYTPYQAEMSQGILQSIFEYQTEIANLTGMDASNASHYDGATAIADGILICMGAKTKAVLSDALNPEYKAVVRTYLVPHGIEVVFAPTKNGVTDLDALKTLIDDEVGAVCIQQPNFFGLIEDAQSASLLQMLDVDFSRRICCSLACKVSTYAGRPSWSTVSPTMRPVSFLIRFSRQVRKPRYGPPKASGSPKGCPSPAATSAPHSAGVLRSASATG